MPAARYRMAGVCKFIEVMEMKDESHLPVTEQSLVFRLRKRAEIRRQIPGRKSVEEGAQDRIATLLDEAADEIDKLEQTIANLVSARLDEL
jgi:hypothetical protein